MNGAYAVSTGLSVNHLLIIPSASPFLLSFSLETRREAAVAMSFSPVSQRTTKKRGKKITSHKETEQRCDEQFYLWTFTDLKADSIKLLLTLTPPPIVPI